MIYIMLKDLDTKLSENQFNKLIKVIKNISSRQYQLT